jgi:hypothetical protein
MNGMLRVPRSRGALCGVLLVLLGAWGALVPFIGPDFHYAYTPDSSWTYTSGRLYLEILPGVGTLLSGLMVLASAYRHMALLGAWLGVLCGAWFALGSVLRPVWNGTGSGGPSAGTPVGGTLIRMWEQVGFFTGLGIAIVLVAAAALGRFSVISVRDARQAQPETQPVTQQADEGRSGRTLSLRRKAAAGAADESAKERVDSGSSSR